MDLELTGRSVVVTGERSNIGRAVTLGFAAEGVALMLGDIDEEQTHAVANRAEATGAPSARFV